MSKIQFRGSTIKVHNVPKPAQDKAMQLIRQYFSGTLNCRKLSNGKYKVLDVDREFRVLIDGLKLHIMNHQCYNKYLQRSK